MYPGRPLRTLSGAAAPAVSRRAGVWCGLQPYLRAISIRVYLSIAIQPQSVSKTPRSRYGIVAHPVVKTQCRWCREMCNLTGEYIGMPITWNGLPLPLSYGAPPSHEVQDEHEVIGEQHPIAEGKPVQAAIGQRELLMDC